MSDQQDRKWFTVDQFDDEFWRLSEVQADVDPLKRWKLSPIDKASLERLDDYTEAKEAMFFYTDTVDAPWPVIKSNDKKRARINCMRHFLSTLDYPVKDPEIALPPDPEIVGPAAKVIHRDDHMLGKALHPDTRHVRNGA